jgi:hypothetical protein
MSNFVIQLDPKMLAGDGTAILRLATNIPGKYLEIRVKNGETITTNDAMTSAALASLGLNVSSDKSVIPLVSPPAKPTYDADKLPRITVTK